MTDSQKRLKEAVEMMRKHVEQYDGTMRWHKHMRQVTEFYDAALAVVEKEMAAPFKRG